MGADCRHLAGHPETSVPAHHTRPPCPEAEAVGGATCRGGNHGPPPTILRPVSTVTSLSRAPPSPDMERPAQRGAPPASAPAQPSLHIVLQKAALAKPEGFLAAGLLADTAVDAETAPRSADGPGKGGRSGSCDRSL